MIDLEVEARKALDLFERIFTAVEQPRPLLEVLAGDLRDYEAQMFATAGRGTWARLNPATIRGKGNALTVEIGRMVPLQCEAH